MTLTAERLRELLDYNPETGLFTRRKQPGRGRGRTGVAGSRTGKGYWEIGIDGRSYQAHRLAFLWMLGRWPYRQVDHANRVRHDNRWCNLRDATNAQNMANKPTRTDLPRGVYWRNERYRRRYMAQVAGVYIGVFHTVEEAAVAARAAYAARGLAEFI